MRLPDATRRAAAIAVHDVSPATWRECREILAMLDDVGASPCSLLVIPHYHYRAPVSRDRAFVRAMQARLSRGDELVLHGFFHIDDAPPPRTPGAWFARRMLTRSEGEFAALDAACRRVANRARHRNIRCAGLAAARIRAARVADERRYPRSARAGRPSLRLRDDQKRHLSSAALAFRAHGEPVVQPVHAAAACAFGVRDQTRVAARPSDAAAAPFTASAGCARAGCAAPVATTDRGCARAPRAGDQARLGESRQGVGGADAARRIAFRDRGRGRFAGARSSLSNASVRRSPARRPGAGVRGHRAGIASAR